MSRSYPLFTDPMYSADLEIEFDANEVVEVVEKRATLFLRGNYWVTEVTLKNGAQHVLKGRVAAEIEKARAVESALEKNIPG